MKRNKYLNDYTSENVSRGILSIPASNLITSAPDRWEALVVFHPGCDNIGGFVNVEERVYRITGWDEPAQVFKGTRLDEIEADAALKWYREREKRRRQYEELRKEFER